MGSLPFHAWFGISLMQSQQVLAEAYYASLDLPWAVNLLEDQNVGGAVAWAAGEVPLYIVTVALFVQWRRSDEKDAARYDRVADRNNDEELAAYNEMLARMSQQVGVGGEDERDYYTSEVDAQHPVHMDNPIDASKRRGR